MQHKHTHYQSLIISGEVSMSSSVIAMYLPDNVDLKTPGVDQLIIDTEKSIGIDVSRQIKTFLASTPISHSHKVVYIKEAETLTLPAQNALLKILEEPPEYAYIVLQSTNPEKLLGTVKSRCLIIRNQQATSETTSLNDWDSLAINQRLEMVMPLQKQRQEAIAFVRQLIYHSREQMKQHPNKRNLFNVTLCLYGLKLLLTNVNQRLVLDTIALNYKV